MSSKFTSVFISDKQKAFWKQEAFSIEEKKDYFPTRI